jgi:hypothetical protein
LADEWRSTDGALLLLEYRQQVRAMLANREQDRFGRPTVIVRGAEDSPAAVQYIEAVMDTAWQALGLAETKVRVAVVIELARPRNVMDRPTREDRVAYLPPDSTDRTTCIAFLPAGPYWTRYLLGKREARHVGFGRFVQWLEAGLGPCAFYAAYGTPGKPVRRWLAARNWDVATHLGTHGIAGERFSSVDLMGDPRYSWYWAHVYSFPPATVACLAGRSSGCRAAVLEGADADSPGIWPQIMRPERRWWRTQRLLPGERYLSDVAREVGRDRFQSFWTSTLPVDSALATALKQPVGEWTSQWERRFIAPIRLGAAAPLGATAIALLLGAVAVLAVMLTASRRQVR